MSKRFVNVMLGVGLVLSLFLNGWLIWKPSSESQTMARENYEFLSPRIFVENPNDVFVGLTPLREAIKQWIDKQDNKISLYFEYLPSGASIGVNEKDEYPLASLFKVPAVMATILRIERGEENWDRELTLTADVMDRNFGDWWKKGVGMKVTVREAINAAVVESDNTAYYLLLKNLPDGYLEGVLQNFDFTTEETSAGVFPVKLN